MPLGWRSDRRTLAKKVKRDENHQYEQPQLENGERVDDGANEVELKGDSNEQMKLW